MTTFEMGKLINSQRTEIVKERRRMIVTSDDLRNCSYKHFSCGKVM